MDQATIAKYKEPAKVGLLAAGAILLSQIFIRLMGGKVVFKKKR